MGEVWRARHQLLARPCAVKLIRPDRLGGNRDAAVGRFRLEARAISRLTSPNTVRLYDFGVSETGSLYFVMELLDGLDLFTLIQRFGPLPAARAVPILPQACRSLAEAHAAGLLHRDIKPHNLFLCRLGVDFDVVKVLDFGLVKSVGQDDANLTADGVLTGTPAYMPPERVTGSPGGETSDLYSLGCVAFWMLTGKPVFSGDPMAMLIHHVRTPPRAPPTCWGRSSLRRSSSSSSTASPRSQRNGRPPPSRSTGGWPSSSGRIRGGRSKPSGGGVSTSRSSRPPLPAAIRATAS